MNERRLEVYYGEQRVTAFTLPDGMDHVEVIWISDTDVQIGWSE